MNIIDNYLFISSLPQVIRYTIKMYVIILTKSNKKHALC
jgi:hypothetical protein